MTLLSLRTGRLAVELAPDAGGSIKRFTVDGSDVLRPMTEADVASGKGTNAAAYPLSRSPIVSAVASWSLRVRRFILRTIGRA
jgi:galactose mutarotase-like enzyme